MNRHSNRLENQQAAFAFSEQYQRLLKLVEKMDQFAADCVSKIPEPQNTEMYVDDLDARFMDLRTGCAVLTISTYSLREFIMAAIFKDPGYPINLKPNEDGVGLRLVKPVVFGVNVAEEDIDIFRDLVWSVFYTLYPCDCGHYRCANCKQNQP